MDGRDYFEVRGKGADAIAHVRRRYRTALIHAPSRGRTRTRCPDDQKKYRGPDELRDETDNMTAFAMEHPLVARARSRRPSTR